MPPSVSLLGFLLFGFVVGLVARAVMPGDQRMGLVKTTLLGVAGSFAGGLVGAIFTGAPLLEPRASGFVGSVIGAVLVMAVFGRR